MAEARVRASVVAAEVEALTGSDVAAAAAAGLRLGLLVGIAEMGASLAVSSAIDVALGQRRRWSAGDGVRFDEIFALTLRHFLALARGVADRGSPDRVGLVGRGPTRAPTLVGDGAPAPRPVNEAIGAFAAAGLLGAKALSDLPSVVVLVVAVGRCIGLAPPEAAQPRDELVVDRGSVDLCLLRGGLRWRRDGEPLPLPATAANLWRPGSNEAIFSWACAQRIASRPGVDAVRLPLQAATAELVAHGADRLEVEHNARELAMQLP